MENGEIDTSISNIRTLYPIDSEFAKEQRTNTGKLIPVEEIVLGLYKKGANCVCFLTNEERIHGWISILAERLYNEKGQNDERYEVIWRDVYEDTTPNKLQTEFIVSKKQIETESESTFVYKVIVYLTAGKIMVQGKEFSTWCKEEFNVCLKMVDQLMSSNAEAGPLQTTTQPAETAASKTGTTKTRPEDQAREITANKTGASKTRPEDQVKDCDPDLTHVKEVQGEQSADGDTNQSMEKKFSNRIDVLESGICKLTDIVSNLVTRIDQQGDNMTKIEKAVKTSVREEIGKWERKDNGNQEKALRNELEDKNKEIKSLKKYLEEKNELLKTHAESSKKDSQQLQKQKEEFNKIRTDLNNEIYKLKTDAQQKQQKIETIEKEATQQQRMFDERMKAKEERIESLQEVISQLRGEEWESQTDKGKCSNQGKQQPSAAPTPQTTSPEEFVIDMQIRESKNEILVLGDSICKAININRLVAGSNKPGQLIRAPTIDSARERLEEIRQPVSTIVVHTGVNDLEKVRKGQNIMETVCENYIKMAKCSRQKADQVIMSLPLPGPSSGDDLENLVDEFNAHITRALDNKDGIKLCTHDQINKRYMYRDEVHPNQQGTKILAANIRTQMNIKKPPSHQRVSTGYRTRTTTEGNNSRSGTFSTEGNNSRSGTFSTEGNNSRSGTFSTEGNSQTGNNHFDRYSRNDRNYRETNTLANDLVRVLTNFLHQK